MSAPQVGDTIQTAEELDALPMDAVVMDADVDAWQWQQGLWVCTDRDASPDALSAYVPFTVIYLPGQPPRPERVVKAEALREWAQSVRDAYPEDVFIPHDRESLREVRDLLAAGGRTLDALSAHLMRHAAYVADFDAKRIEAGESS